MYVNPFWFGVLMTIFALMVVAMILSFVAIKREERWQEEEDDQKESDKRDK